MDAKTTARERVEELRGELIELSHRIHSHPELGFQEVQACGWLTETLHRLGFEVEAAVYDLPTAFVARTGHGPLHVALTAEYDALPGIGHACGHNIIAASAVGAGAALARLADEVGLTVTVIGTPFEEGGAGKQLLLDRGAFDGIHAVAAVHPGPRDVWDPVLIASRRFDVEYTGKPAHAAGAPEAGINAADAFTVAQVALGLLRQHILPTDRLHGIMTKGGDAPNIVPAHTAGSYMVRSRTLEEAEKLYQRVEHCFQAGALATGAKLKIEAQIPYAELRQDPDMAAYYRSNAEVLGRVFASGQEVGVLGSTDLGNVSRVIPTIQPSIGLDCLPVVNHQPEFAAASVTDAGDRAILDGAVALAWTLIDTANDSKLRERLLQRESQSSRFETKW